MNLQDVDNIMTSERAEERLYLLMREGLTNAVAIPDVMTEADQAAHHMLGCVNYMALIATYGAADDMRHDESTTDELAAAAVITDLADSHLRILTQAIIYLRGPIGPHRCGNGQ